MTEIYAADISGPDFLTDVVEMPGNTNALKVTLSHWDGATLDLDMRVSYDGGANWLYGGGCKGAISAEGGIEFHFTYGDIPTHVSGSLSSERPISSKIRFIAGE